MKKNPPNVWVRPHCVKKMLQVMKLALLFVVLFFTSASAFTQRVSLSVKAETTLNEVLKQVKDQTGVRILYDAGKMKRVPCREMKIVDLEIEEALKQILKDTRFEFFEEGGVFIVREALSQQAKVIRLVGKVTDERKQPLPGVTVQLKGFSIGTATNGEGRYQLSIPNAPEKFSLVFSFVGMVSQEIVYAGKDTIDLVMKEDVETRNQADQMVYQSEKTLNEMGDKIPAEDKSKVQAGIDKLKEALKGTDTAAIKTATDALTQDFYAVSEKLYQQANPQGAQGGAQAGPDMGGQQAGGAQDGQYYDADYKVVDDDDQNKK